MQALSKPFGIGGDFLGFCTFFRVLKLEFPVAACLSETSIFKIIIIDDVTFWSKFEYMIIGNKVYWILLILFHN